MAFEPRYPRLGEDCEEEWEVPVMYSYLMVLTSKVENLLYTFEEIEGEFREKYETSPAKYNRKIKASDESDWRIRISSALHAFYGWGSVSLSDFEQGLKSLSFCAKDFIQRQITRAINWLLRQIISFFKRFATHLRVQGWSIGGEVGFPTTFGINISVTFEP